MFLLLDFTSLSIVLHIYYKEDTTGPTQISANDKQKETDIISMLPGEVFESDSRGNVTGWVDS